MNDFPVHRPQSRIDPLMKPIRPVMAKYSGGLPGNVDKKLHQVTAFINRTKWIIVMLNTKTVRSVTGKGRFRSGEDSSNFRTSASIVSIYCQGDLAHLFTSSKSSLGNTSLVQGVSLVKDWIEFSREDQSHDGMKVIMGPH